MFFTSYRTFYNEKKKEINLFSLIIKIIIIIFAHTINMTTARARSVFLSSYRNMVFDQSAHVLALGYMYFLKHYSITICSVIKGSSIRKQSSRHYLWQPNSMNYYFKTEQLRNKFHTIVESFTDVEHLTLGVGIFFSFPCRTEKDKLQSKTTYSLLWKMFP